MSAIFRAQGRVALAARPDWVAGPSFAASCKRDGTAGSFQRAGAVLRWHEEHAQCAAGEDTVCIAWGRPRWLGSRSPAGVAELMSALDATGPAALERLDGGFAIVFASRRLNRVLLAVDRFSMETMCYAVENGTLAFSDRADAVPLARRTISAQSVYHYAYLHVIPAPRTIFGEVRRLENGTFLLADGGALSDAAYWQPRFAVDRTISLGSRSQAFREALQFATAAEIEGDSTGCFLSGGTDSSTVAGMVGLVTGAPPRTYSIGFDEAGYDEMEYARIAARHFGASHHEYYVTADDVVAAVPQLVASVDQPFGNSSAVPAYFCARMAGADGITRMLAGDGGDELFGGNTRYRLQHALDLYGRVPARLRTALAPLASRRTTVPGLRHLAGYVRAASLPMPDRLESHNLVTRIGAAQIFTRDLLHDVDIARPLEEQRTTYAAGPGDNIIDRMLYYDWKYTLADTDLPKVRSAVALAGVGVGYPLLAQAVVEQALRLPPGYKVRGTSLRWFFKRALRGFLPPATLRKKKHGFGMPFGAWAARNAKLSDLAADALAALEQRRLLIPGFRDELMRTLVPAHPGYYGELLYILMMLGLWLVSDAAADSARTTPARLVDSGVDAPAG